LNHIQKPNTIKVGQITTNELLQTASQRENKNRGEIARQCIHLEQIN